jgi:hypothetical protein
MTGLELSTKKLATELDTKWKPLFCKMMEAPWIELLPDDIDEQFIESSYTITTSHLKQVVSYVWLKVDVRWICKYTIRTWSRKVAYSEIEHLGTPEGIARLPPAARQNKLDQSKRGGWRIEKSTVMRVVPRRQEWLDPEVGNDLFWEAFSQFPVSE